MPPDRTPCFPFLCTTSSVLSKDRSVAGLDGSGWLSFAFGMKSRLLLNLTYKIFYDLASARSLTFCASYLHQLLQPSLSLSPSFFHPTPILLSRSVLLTLYSVCSFNSYSPRGASPRTMPPTPHSPSALPPSTQCSPAVAHTVLSSAWLGRLPIRM